MPEILKKEHYEDVRARLGSASDSIVSDTLIERDMYLGLGEAEIKERVSDWQTIVSEGEGVSPTATQLRKLYRLRSATVGYVAGLLIPFVQRLVKSEDILDYKYVNLTAQEWDDLRARLMGESQEDLETLIDPTDMALINLDGPSRAASTRTIC